MPADAVSPFCAVFSQTALESTCSAPQRQRASAELYSPSHALTCAVTTIST